MSAPTSNCLLQSFLKRVNKGVIVSSCLSVSIIQSLCSRLYFQERHDRPVSLTSLFIWVLRCFQHCTGHITMGSWKGRGNQYMQFVRVLYCKLSTNDKQLPAFPLEAVPGTEPQPQREVARVLPLCHCGPPTDLMKHDAYRR